MVIGLDAGSVYQRPCSDLGEIREGRGCEGAGAVGILVLRQMPFPSAIEVLRLNKRQAEVRSLS